MRIDVSLRRVRIILTVMLVALVAAGWTAEYARYRLHSTSQLVDYFSLSEEQNVPTWWSSSLLLACSAVLAAVTATKPRRAGEFKTHWRVLAAIFFYLSLDELVEIHERLNDLHSLGNFSGPLYYGWVVPAVAIVAVVGASYLKFIAHLPKQTRTKAVLAAALFVGGALGVEFPLGMWSTQHGELNLGWALIDSAEEALELMGSSLFLYTLVEYLGRSQPDLALAIGPGGR